MYWDYYCPSCGKKEVKEIKYPEGLLYCSCGMVWQPVSTATAYADYTNNSDLKTAITNVLNETLEVYYTKNEDVNKNREYQKTRCVEYLTNEILKGPFEGGTMAEPNSICSLFGSSVWNALQKAILLRDNVCQICEMKPSKEVHHIRPRHLKGKDHPRNLIGLCLDCHDEVHRKIDNGIQSVCESSLTIKNPKFQSKLE